MDVGRLSDRISRGMGIAAQVMGEPYDVFRPKGVMSPLAAENRFATLPVILDGGNPGYSRPRGYARSLRAGFDGVDVRVGDYLRGPRGVLFVAALPRLLRPLCVLTTTVVDVIRTLGPASAGLNGYGGVVTENLESVLSGWPAEMLIDHAGRDGLFPGDSGQTSWSVLLPALPAAVFASDLIVDPAGAQYVVRSAEQTELGWRLLVRGAEV